jgi:hypothetical protein
MLISYAASASGMLAFLSLTCRQRLIVLSGMAG